MNKLIAAIKRMPKFSALIAVGASAILIPATLFAWGPDRPTYTMAHPSDHVTFNSITDNPNYGDERQFVTVKDLTAGTSTLNSIDLVEGHEYQAYIYIHNNASDTLNASGVGIAKGVKVQSKMPSTVNGSASVAGYVYASNASPKEVYDTADLKSSKAVTLEYVPGSASIVTHYYTSALSDSLVTVGNVEMPYGGGVSVGSNDLSGSWKACLGYAGYISYKFKVKQPTVVTHPNVDIVKTVNSKETDKVEVNKPFTYELTVTNSGDVDLTNVLVTDKAPAGIAFISTDHGTISANALSYTIPSLKVKAQMTIKITAKATKYLAGVTTNTACVSTPVVDSNKPECDTATTTMPTPIQVCELATKTVISINPEDFDSAKHSKNLDDCKDIKVCRLSDKTVVTISLTQYNESKDKYSTTLSDCDSTPPVTPPELPHTGAGDIIVSILGAGSLAAVIGAYLASRRAHLGA